MKLICYFIAVACFATTISAQSPVDTLSHGYSFPMMEVTANATRGEKFAVISIEKQSILYGIQSHLDLGAMLERSGAAVLSITGAPGSSSTARFGGFSSDHSIMLWNGMPINSLSLGTCDLSLIPSLFVDQAVLYRSPSVNELPSTGLGMSLDLKSNFDADQAGYFRTRLVHSSLKNSALALDQFHKISFDRRSKSKDEFGLFWRTRGIISDQKNEFDYRDNYLADAPVIAQHHNNSKHHALLNDFYLKSSVGIFSLHHWYGKRRSALPAIMGRYASGSALQRDDVNRTLLKWASGSDKYQAEATCGYFQERLVYLDLPLANGDWYIHSDVQTASLMSRLKISYSPTKRFQTAFFGTHARQVVENSNYEDGKAQINWYQAGADVLFNLGKFRLSSNLLQDSRHFAQGPAASLTTEWSTAKHNTFWRLHLTAARRFRVPDMNELFWTPGGNPDLLPENSVAVNGGAELRIVPNENISVVFSPNAHHADVSNWIQWVPTENSYWSPVNYRHVKSTGFELPVVFNMQQARHHVFGESRWIGTRAIHVNAANGEDKMMIYTPRLVFAGALGYKNNRMNAAIRFRHTAERYTDELNSVARSLPAFEVFGFNAGFISHHKLHDFELSIDIENLFDVRYESVRSYAIPGRLISLQLSVFISTRKITIHEK